MTEIDLSHVNILISSPSADGTWEDGYMESFISTKLLLEKYGAKVEWRRAKYCADVYAVRAKLFADFYKNDEATHMMMIDADMTWQACDVVRMLQLDRQFLAVAGPKKLYPIEFAFNIFDNDGYPADMTQEMGTNVATVTHVGGAFVLIKKEVASRLIQSYPDLEYYVSPGVTEFAIFDPIIMKGKLKRRLSEDYAFCQRWRDIGGKVEMVTDIKLGHTGSHTFIGSLEESLQEKEAELGLQPYMLEVNND